MWHLKGLITTWIKSSESLRCEQTDLWKKWQIFKLDHPKMWDPATFWRRRWQPTPVLLPGKSHGWRSLVGCGPWACEESDTTGRLPFHFSLSCIGEGGGTPLQCSCLENPRDGRVWWAAICGVAQSRTRLKWLSSSSSSRERWWPHEWPYVDWFFFLLIKATKWRELLIASRFYNF